MSFDASSFIDTALIALPMRDSFTKRSRRIKIIAAATIVNTLSMRIFAPQISPREIFSRTRPLPVGLEFVRRRITSESTMEIPTADVSMEAIKLRTRMRTRRKPVADSVNEV